jgi:hypothetical protein
MAFMVLQILVCEQNLRDVKIVFGEKFIVSGHEAGLADGGAGLQFRKLAGPFFETERAHARAHRAGGDEHHFPARMALFSDLARELFHLGQVRLLPVVREDTGSQLDDNTASLSQQLISH